MGWNRDAQLKHTLPDHMTALRHLLGPSTLPQTRWEPSLRTPLHRLGSSKIFCTRKSGNFLNFSSQRILPFYLAWKGPRTIIHKCRTNLTVMMEHPTDLLPIENTKPKVQNNCASPSCTAERLFKKGLFENIMMDSKTCSFYAKMALWSNYSRFPDINT